MADELFGFTESQVARMRPLLAWYEQIGRHLTGPGQRSRVLIPATPRRVTCLLKGALASGSTSATVDNVSSIAGVSPTTSSTSELTVANTHNWDATDNALARAEFHRTNERWELYQVTCVCST
jgi:hypothetical protein